MEHTGKKWWFGGSAVVIAGVVFAGVTTYQSHDKAQQQDHAYRSTLAISDAGNAPESDFTLADQRGQKITLSDLKGKTVILEFMDPVCTDICPIVSAETIQANNDLGNKANDVVYLAVNVNEYHESEEDVQKFSQEHGLNQLPNWHFVTGNTSQLKAIWKDYGIMVKPNPDGDVEHSSFMYFIDKNGKERYIGDTEKGKHSVSEMGQAMAYFADKLS